MMFGVSYPSRRSIVPFSFSTLSSIFHSHTYSSRSRNASVGIGDSKPQNPVFFNYLVETLGFPKQRALSISEQYWRVNAIDKPQSVVHLLKSFGFSDTHIHSSMLACPKILLSNPEKILKPKLQFLHELGLSGSYLGEIVSKNPILLAVSLDRKIKPLINVFEKILGNDVCSKDMIRVLRRCGWFVVGGKVSLSRIASNAEYLESCGIVASKVSKLFVRNPRIFAASESHLRELVSRVLNMGFVMQSPIFPIAFFRLNSLSEETLSKKLELIRSFGFSDAESLQMFANMPDVLGLSEKNLKLGFDFFLNTVKLERSILVRNPSTLAYNLKKRTIPRYSVFQIIKWKKLLKKEPSFTSLLVLTDEKFMNKYILRFVDHADELLVAYKGDTLCAPPE